jgi:CubicO group peptidase (beta-lactamase class C family)
MIANLSDRFNEMMEAWDVPGFALAVVHRGEVILSDGFGYRDVERSLKVTPDTRFAIGSTTKAFTTMAMAMLVDEGVLAWDTPVRNYLPSFKLYDPIATERITPRDLVTHCSGLPRHDNLWVFSTGTRAELVQRLQYIEPTWDLRAVYQYSNLMFMMAGYLVEQLSGCRWEEFVEARILSVLGMARSSPGLTSQPGFSDFALPYQQVDGAIRRIPFFSKDAVGPAGSMCSTANDLTRWLLLHLGRGERNGQALVSQENLRQMHTAQMVIRDAGQLAPGERLNESFDEFGASSYGLGWRITPYRRHTLIHHGGQIDGFSAMVSFMPDEDMGVAVLTNRHETPFPYVATLSIYDRLLNLAPIDWSARIKAMVSAQATAAERSSAERAASRRPGTQPSHASLEDYAGDFEHPAYGIFCVIAQDGWLTARYGGQEFPLNHYHYDVFTLTAGPDQIVLPISFFGDVKGNISHLSIPLEPAVKDIVFARQTRGQA